MAKRDIKVREILHLALAEPPPVSGTDEVCSHNRIKQRYFRADGYWTFYGKDAELVRITATPIRRFVKVSGRNSPFDPKLRAYWQGRTKAFDKRADSLKTGTGTAEKTGRQMCYV